METTDSSSSSQKVSGSASDPNSSLKCALCDATETPVWRNGPLGPKSLCNACGLRYNRRATKVLELESEDGNLGEKKKRRGRKRRSMEGISEQKASEEAEMAAATATATATTTTMTKKKSGAGSAEDSLSPRSQQHRDEVETAAIQLMDLSRADRHWK